MSPDRSRVIVEDGLCSCCSVPSRGVHHRHFPEIRAECGSVAEAAAHLADRLSLYRDGAQSVWHREDIALALADVAEFLASLSEATSSLQGSCLCTPHAPEPAMAAASGKASGT